MVREKWADEKVLKKTCYHIIYYHVLLISVLVPRKLLIQNCDIPKLLLRHILYSVRYTPAVDAEGIGNLSSWFDCADFLYTGDSPQLMTLRCSGTHIKQVFKGCHAFSLCCWNFIAQLALSLSANTPMNNIPLSLT
jgi:hypothetical protein